MKNWTATVERYLAEGRTVSGGKGSDKADAQRQQELDMQNSANQFQMAMIKQLSSDFSKYTTGAGQGFSPEQLAASRSQFLNSNNSTFNQAGQQVRAALGARGEGTGQNPVGGTYGSGIASLMSAKAGSQSQGLLGLNIQNMQQALMNKFNAGNILSGNAATLTGTQGVAGAGASSALNSYITAANQGFGNAFTTGLGGAFGGALGKGLNAGLAQGAANAFGCWIAESIWGIEDPRTHLVRFWLNFDFGQRWYGRPVMRLYLKYGEWISKKPSLVKLLRPLFDLALEKAVK